MSCCRSFLKLSITFANILFAVIGLLMLLGGLWITYDQNDILEKIANITENTNLPEAQKDNLEDLYNYKYLNFLVIGIGALTFLVALIGFCGSVKESSCLLSTHIFLAAVLLVIQVSIIAFINIQDKSLTDLKEDIKDVLQLGAIQISHRIQTIFFGATSGATLIFLMASIYLWKSSSRKSDGYMEPLSI